MKKILIFSIAYYPLVGGAEVAIKEITDRISDIHFDMITLRFNKSWPKFEKIGNVNVYRAKSGKLLFPFLGYLKAKKLQKECHFDAIWSIMASYSGFAALFFKFFNPEIPFLLTLQEGDSEEHILKRVGIFYPLWKKIFSKADYIQTISNYLADFAKKYGARVPIKVIPNGVDIEKFKSQTCPTARRVSDLKNKEEKILITTSRLVKKNAVDDVIKALQYLPENIKFWIIGDGEENSNLKSQISNLKLQNRVKFFGYLPHEEMIKYLHAADVFIRPSLSEGMGNSFIEAMAAGIPVIATPVGGIPDFLKDRETGLFCEVRNPKSIAEKVKIYLENEELRRKIIKNAQEMVNRNYDWDLIAKDMREKVFGKILS
ncbi:MAG: glycosyltransferase family 4 protein [Patescibacteria group bacterium]